MIAVHRQWLLPFLLIVPPITAVGLDRARVRSLSSPARQSRSPIGPAALDSLQVIGEFPPVVGEQLIVFGDTDHDGLNEIILGWVDKSSTAIVRIYESVAYGQFAFVFEGPSMYPSAVGDLDQDGKTDIVGQKGSVIRVYEAVDQHSYPSVLVWQSPPLSNIIGYPRIADTDGDGQLEIIHWIAGLGRLVIYECAGDNTYVQKFLSDTDPLAGGQRLIDDLDGDGHTEIAFGGWGGALHVFESTGDDAWEQTFVEDAGLGPAKVLAGGIDTDGNGIKELFLAGQDPDTGERKTAVYEADGSRSFARVATLVAFDNASGGQSGALARTEYDGRTRFLWDLFQQLRIYVSTGIGTWSLESIFPDPGPYNDIHARDLNRNGRDEIYWITSGSGTSLILERPTVAVDTANDLFRPGTASLRVAPSPSHGVASIFLDPALLPKAHNWSIFDASGRLVFREALNPLGGTAPWTLPALRPGLYFLRATDANGSTLATGRATVVR